MRRGCVWQIVWNRTFCCSRTIESEPCRTQNTSEIHREHAPALMHRASSRIGHRLTDRPEDDTMRNFAYAAALITAAYLGALVQPASAQSTDSASRQAVVEQAQAEKSAALSPYVPGTFERVSTQIENMLVNGTAKWHPFFQNAYRGGGFAPGLGYIQHPKRGTARSTSAGATASATTNWRKRSSRRRASFTVAASWPSSVGGRGYPGRLLRAGHGYLLVPAHELRLPAACTPERG